MTDHVEAAVRALHPVHQRRMAHLVLRGWVIQHSVSRYETHAWTARMGDDDQVRAEWTFALKIYSSHTLMTLLDQMVGVVEDMECTDLAQRARELLPDGAMTRGGLPSR